MKIPLLILTREATIGSVQRVLNNHCKGTTKWSTNYLTNNDIRMHAIHNNHETRLYLNLCRITASYEKE